jgi:NADPH:quinone reductase
MIVVQATSFGDPDVLAAVAAPDPGAGPGEVVVRVTAADVMFLDTMIRRGLAIDIVPLRPPYVPGSGVAGQVIATGRGVDPQWIGSWVAAHTGGTGGGGGYAERALIPAAALVPVPEGVGVQAAAALLHDGATALGLAENAGIKAGEWVLVVGAGGGLGLLLVQLARTAGAHVIAAARGRGKLGQAADLGAEVTVDYSEDDWPQQVLTATGGSGANVVFDGAGTDLGQAAFTITADGGRFSAHGTPSGGFAQIDMTEAKRRDITVTGIEQVQYTPGQLHALAARALAAAADGLIQPVIGQTFPLDRAADAHAAIESRAVTGKTLLLTSA